MYTIKNLASLWTIVGLAFVSTVGITYVVVGPPPNVWRDVLLLGGIVIACVLFAMGIVPLIIKIFRLDD